MASVSTGVTGVSLAAQALTAPVLSMSSSLSGPAKTKAISTAPMTGAERRSKLQSLIIPGAFMPITSVRLSGLAVSARPQMKCTIAACTAKITTATRQKALTIPIQALTIRQRGDLDTKPKTGAAAPAATKLDPAAEKANKEEIQGVFVVAGGKAVFHKVETGITGVTDIEVLSGLNPGDEIVTGTYQVIRTLRNENQVKVDNRPAQTKT